MRKQTELAAVTLASLTLMIGGCGSGDDADSTPESANEHAGHSHDENGGHDEHTDAAQLTEDTVAPSIAGLTDVVEGVVAGGLGLSLDDGKKWQMDDHTRASIAQLTEIVDGANIDSLESAIAIGGQLKAAMTGLMEGSMMEGLGGEQLQAFIGKFMPKLDSLAGAVNFEAAQAEFAEIKTMLTGFSAIFE